MRQSIWCAVHRQVPGDCCCGWRHLTSNSCQHPSGAWRAATLLDRPSDPSHWHGDDAAGRHADEWRHSGPSMTSRRAIDVMSWLVERAVRYISAPVVTADRHAVDTNQSNAILALFIKTNQLNHNVVAACSSFVQWVLMGTCQVDSMCVLCRQVQIPHISNLSNFAHFSQHSK